MTLKAKPKALPPHLTKSTFVAGMQCELKLYHDTFETAPKSSFAPDELMRLEEGKRIQEIAREQFGPGVLIKDSSLHFSAAVQNTKKYLKDPTAATLFEAAFETENLKVRVDILRRNEKEPQVWDLYEVKSGTKYDLEKHLGDVSVQYHVLKLAGVQLNKVFLTHLSKDYEGGADYSALFESTDITKDVLAFQPKVASYIEAFEKTLSDPTPPEIDMGHHCKRPYQCHYWEHCIKNKPEHWIMEIPRISEKKYAELSAEGIHSIKNIPVDYKLTEFQLRVRDCVQTGKEYISDEIKNVFAAVEFPVYFLDFETLLTGLPRYKGVKPYQKIPFQFSVHVLDKAGDISHHSYLHASGSDPRPMVAKNLLKVINSKGTIVVYTSYEESCIDALCQSVPEHSEKLEKLLLRFLDLHKVIQDHYYHPEFHGSLSLKNVAPVMQKELSYSGLAVQDGGAAMATYLKLLELSGDSANQAEINDLKSALLEYCQYDTYALLRIFQKLSSLDK